jgi:hypothetical protein
MVLDEVTIGPVGTHDGQTCDEVWLPAVKGLEEKDLAPIWRPHWIGSAASFFGSVLGQVAEMLAIRVDDMHIAVLRLKNDLVPCGDQTASPAPMAYEVIWVACPLRSVVNSAAPSSPSRVNTNRRPSGENRGTWS